MGLLSERSEDDGERGDIVLSGLPIGDVDELVYELDDWSERDRSVLRERLEVLAVPHRWEDLSLVIASADEAWVERVMDQVDDLLAESLDDDAEQVGYELEGWDEANRSLLAERLSDEAIPHEMEGSELLVHEIDEQRVDEIIEAILHPDAEQAVGVDAGAVMGDLFVAADRLVRDPRDHDGTLGLVAAIRAGESAPAPYGMDKVWWQGVLAQAGELVVLMEGHAPDDEAVQARAATLRDALRPYV